MFSLFKSQASEEDFNSITLTERSKWSDIEIMIDDRITYYHAILHNSAIKKGVFLSKLEVKNYFNSLKRYCTEFSLTLSERRSNKIVNNTTNNRENIKALLNDKAKNYLIDESNTTHKRLYYIIVQLPDNSVMGCTADRRKIKDIKYVNPLSKLYIWCNNSQIKTVNSFTKEWKEIVDSINNYFQ